MPSMFLSSRRRLLSSGGSIQQVEGVVVESVRGAEVAVTTWWVPAVPVSHRTPLLPDRRSAARSSSSRRRGRVARGGVPAPSNKGALPYPTDR
jgi:hypothetical protein